LTCGREEGEMKLAGGKEGGRERKISEKEREGEIESA
jgi:hypothetical protein